jgi:hypothetical protein
MGIKRLPPHEVIPHPTFPNVNIVIIKEHKVLIDTFKTEELLQYSWCPDYQKDGRTYFKAWINGKGIRLHKFLTNTIGKGIAVSVDHRNHDYLDCRLANLIIGTQQENSQNKSMQKNNTTGYTGVTYCPYRNKSKPYLARVSYKGKRVFCKYFATALEAGEAARINRLKWHKGYVNPIDLIPLIPCLEVHEQDISLLNITQGIQSMK